jgi:PAS domain S-box-containing protein
MPKPEDTLDMDEMPCYYAYPIYSGDDIEAYVSMDFDIPTRGGLEEKLQRTNAFLRNLIFSAVDGVIASDMEGKILIFNEAAAKVFGYTIDEALNNVKVRDIYPEKNAFEVMQDLRSEDYGGKGKLRSYLVDVISKNGEIVPISLNAAIVYENGQEVATIGFFHDLREQLRMKEELEKTQIQLLQSEKMASLGKLAAGVAHQLNNPLGGITLFTKLIMEEYDLEDGAKEDLNRILKDANRCRDTVRELLEFTRQTRHLMRPSDVNRALTRTLFLLESQTLFQNIDIVKDLDASLPPVYGDIQQLNHLFMNIILNAAQAMVGKGKLTIKSRLLSDTDRACIEISDTGPGIPEDILPHIFEPFFTTKEEGKGTGLGLSLAYRIVENHGGHIKAESKPDEGTKLFIELPIAAKDLEGD